MRLHINFDKEFKKNNDKGLYIVIEGIDGSGKTTQVENLKKYFEKKGKEVVVTSEPTSIFETGKLMRDILNAKIKIPSKAFQFIYSSDRILNHEKIIIPSLQKGSVVLSHRSFWSIVPYGFLDKGVIDYNRKDADALFVSQGVLSYYYQFLKADFTFYLDVSVNTAMHRMEKMKKTRDIYEKREKLATIVRGYKWQAKQFRKEIIVINGEKTEREVTIDILANLKDNNKVKSL